jgi:hypothetical protein
MLAAIENGGNPIAEAAQQNSITEHEFGMVTMPSAGPKISVTGGIRFNPDPMTGSGFSNGIETVFHPGQLGIDYTPNRLDYRVLQYASLNIEYQPSKIDVTV